MTVFTEFVLVAVLIYLWESSLWLPRRGIALRKRWFGNRWKALEPDSLFATRETGLVPMLPLPSDAGLAPCQAPPLFADAEGSLWLENSEGRSESLGRLGWEDLKEEPPYFIAGGRKTRLTSPRCIGVLRRARQRGATPEMAVRQAMRLAVSPLRAGREWKRWLLVSSSLRFFGPILTVGFFGGLPLAYVKLGTLPTLLLGLWLWLVMVWTAGHVWWLGRRVYPDAKGAFQMDALLSVLVPFHAMRAMEIASVHAMGTTHPVGLILSTGDFENPWLAGFVRRVLHPLAEEAGRAAAIREPLSAALISCGRNLEDFDTAPDRSNDAGVERYCPRCHGLFLASVESCRDCRGMRLRRFEGNP